MGAKLPPQKDIESAGRELKESPPRIVSHTRRKFGKRRARKQEVAVMLDKARRSAKGRSMRSRR